MTGNHDWDKWLAAASVAPEVFALQPTYRVLLIVADGIEPGPSDEASDHLLAAAEIRARDTLAGRSLEDVGQLAHWRDAYQSFGAKPKRTRPSVEALVRRSDAGLPRIDKITDTYNAISVAHLLPLGGEDVDAYQGAPRLVRATGEEVFETVSSGEPTREHPAPGEVVWLDDAGVTCRRWNWRQCTRTRIMSSTTRALFILDALGTEHPEEPAEAGHHLTAALSAFSPNLQVVQRLITAA
jgi:DNA/RNA-binding domain of Phe-tRNA-synthetase-like protein